MITRVIATAGHVDHGKSSLVQALTGTNPDRFEEERRRGLTIDLGFAHTVLESGAVASFVDVPGHARFLRNMLAGVGAVEACVFVVAANEGWKPQSEEHLHILQLLGTSTGLITLTKADLVDRELLDMATMDVSEHVAGTFLHDAPIIPVATRRGEGIDTVRSALDDLVHRAPQSVDRGRPRLWVDRAFTIHGSGTVVTGTLTGGTLSVGASVVVEPGSRPARIRTIQSHAVALDEIGPGNRVALNLAGIQRSEVQRGDAVVIPRRWRTTNRLDVTLVVLPNVERAVSRRGAYMAYVGSREVPVRVSLIGASELAPGTAGCARLFLPCPLPLLPGDRFVLREAGRNVTIGGGEILDIDPVKSLARATPDRSVERVVSERGWVDVAELELLTGQPAQPVLGRWVVSAPELGATRARLAEAVRAAGVLGLPLAVLADHEQAVVAGLDDVTIDAGRARLAGGPDPFVDHPLASWVRAGGFQPTVPEGTDRATVRELVRRGVLVECNRLLFHSDTVRAATDLAADLLTDDPSGFTISTFCQRAGTSRKFALAIVNELDSRGVTRRRDGVRVAGPRLPRA